ncbi:hypothetical protein [Hyphomicrobium sp.]|uniref:hypothetical protein n=1 Tax=Hyphomicrobium sp. TaxID=82 RepID=UPI001D7DEE9D|nr:hypothetical protein [Hyphomicrobium sp.]MBY0561425.1 hypothetical protein [Hyphomicrobium sp.]
MNSNLREMHRFAEERGWMGEPDKKFGYRFTHPQIARPVKTTGSNHTEELLRFKSEIRRAETQAGIRHTSEHMVKVESDGNPFAALAPLRTVLATPSEDNLLDLDDAETAAEPVEEKKRRSIKNSEPFPMTIEPGKSGALQAVSRVQCCLCPESAVIHSRKATPPSLWILTMNFRGKGWLIGRTRTEDVCPSCVSIMDGKPPEKMELCQPTEALPAPHMAAPVTMTPSHMPLTSIPVGRQSLSEKVVAINMQAHRAREDFLEEERQAELRYTALWRRIHRAIDKAYIDADTGYAAGESDEKIAKRFNVKVEEVAARREEFFGPSVADSSRRDIVRELHALKKDLSFFTKNVLDAAANLEGRIATLLNKIEAAPDVAKRLLETTTESHEANGQAHAIAAVN